LTNKYIYYKKFLSEFSCKAKGLFFVLVIVGGFDVWAQPSVQIVYTTEKPKIDGRLDEALWKNAAKIDQFYQREPDTGSPISRPTEVYLCYDEHHLYIGLRCFDNPKEITAKEMARDVSLGEDDRVQIIFDTFLDGRNGYWFQIGPLGSIGDAIISDNGAAFNKDWDGLWEGKANIHGEGWDAELKIPFKTLKFKSGQSTWGLKIIRHIKRRLESGYWPAANLDSYRFQVSDGGLLTGLEGITQGIGLDINPYGLAGYDHKFGLKDNYLVDAGVDVFYQLTSGISSALTINTDFAQTEVDSRQINLTRFSLHFPEKRDFFLDGANYFNFGIGGSETRHSKRLIPFFSRRVGLDNSGNPIPIIWGAKMTGQAGKWNMGFMNIADDRNGRNENFAVGRVTRNIGDQSSLGVIGTHGNSFFNADNLLLGADTRLRTSKFMGDKNLGLDLYALKSHTEGLTGRDFSFGGEASYPNDFLAVRLGHFEIQENFRAGVGFVPRIGIKNSYGSLFLGPRPKKFGVLQYRLGGAFDMVKGMNNVLLTREVELKPLDILFLSGDQIGFSSNLIHEYIDRPFNIYKQDTIEVGEYDFNRNTIELASAQRRNLWAGIGYTWGSFFDGRRQDIRFAFGYKVAVPLYLGLEYQQNNIQLSNSRFTAHIYRLVANVLFSPDVILSNYVQYDSKSMNMGWQSRLRWIMKPGKEFLVVWNSFIIDPMHQENMSMTESSVRVKAKYNIRF
jgi:hypothetical protein